jgi:hypothetical protein
MIFDNIDESEDSDDNEEDDNENYPDNVSILNKIVKNK